MIRCKRSRKNRAIYKERGFTLLEILVAVIIFAFIIVGAQQIFAMASANAQALDLQQKRLRQLNMTLQSIERDLNQVISRSIRAPGSGFVYEPIQTDINDNFLLKVTRGGWKNPLYAARPEVQAATYYLKDDKLMRSYFPYLDTINDADPIEQELLDRVETVEIKFLLLRPETKWHEDWPVFQLTGISSNNANSDNSSPVNEQEETLSAPPRLPVAVEILIELEDHGVIRRLINIAPAA